MEYNYIEKLVSKALQAYKFIGFFHDTIAERDLFLSLLTCSLLEKTSPKSASNVWELLPNSEVDYAASSANCEMINQTDSIKTFVIDLRNRISKYKPFEKYQNAVNEIRELSSDVLFSQLDKIGAVALYDRILQRLQAMNLPDHLDNSFVYQTPSFNVSSLVSKLVPLGTDASVYDPYAMTGESMVDFALFRQVAQITTESVSQSSTYINHKLLIAGATSIKTMNSFSMSPQPNVRKQQFNLAFTLLQPSMSSEIEGAGHRDTRKIAGEFDHERIPEKVIISRFWEHALIHHILYSLKPDGTAVIFTGLGPLVRQSDYVSRQLLLERNQIDAVIQLPAKLIDYRTVPLFATILKKNRKKSESIKFIDASGYCYFENGVNHLNSLDEIASLYHSSNTNLPNVAYVLVDEVMGSGCTLNVANYVESLDEEIEYIDFEDTHSALLRQQKITNMCIERLEKTLL